jgi:hypothetical protein
MSEHDDNQDPTPAAHPAGDPLDSAAVQSGGPPQPVDVAPAAAAVPAPPPPAEPTTRWRDRVFRMRSVAAVAVAGVILGAAGGAVTTALVTDDDRGDGPGRPGFGQMLMPGQMPAVPPDGRQGFPGMPGQQDGDSDDDQDFPVPPGSDSDGSDSGSDSSDSGTGQSSSYSQS